MIATFRENQLTEAHDIMAKHNSRLIYSVVEINGSRIYIVERGPMAAIVIIRANLSTEEDLKLIKAL